ncbi:MAG TPA: transglycosylase SLT domain-containing protein, partial [Chitinophagales bacterium]|nr:transglycosylase SLT domain-containing protein [Chitinophagales bacterium]
YARRIGWDWRLLAALIYEESQFDAASCSWAGAEGLMQLVTTTGLRFGALDLSNPEQNVMAGTAYLQYLETHWKDIPDSAERMKFVLASYNVGEGHVRDAMRLAEKYGADPFRWEGNVAVYLVKKSQPKYYNDAAATSGYCRGTAAVTYVKQVLERYAHYRQRIEAG